MKDFLEIANYRYATKHYDKDKKIPQKDLDEILEALRLTPSAVNLQPWKFFVGTTEAAKQKILPAIPDFNIPRVADSSAFIVFTAYENMTQAQYDRVTQKEDEDGRYPNHPEIRDTVGEHRISFAKMHENLGDFYHWGAKQNYIAMATVAYAAASKGIDNTILEGLDFAKLDEILNLKEQNLKSVGIVVLGYRKDDTNAVRPKSRLNKDEVIVSID